jgi:2-haloalkanoic acid dehalogenase type II
MVLARSRGRDRLDESIFSGQWTSMASRYMWTSHCSIRHTSFTRCGPRRRDQAFRCPRRRRCVAAVSTRVDVSAFGRTDVLGLASIGAAALDMVASARGITLSPADRSRILQGMLTLSAHPDVRDGLQAMRDAGLRLVTLTDSAPAAVQQQLTNAGLTAFFERSFSVDTVRRFKPAAEAYRAVADSLGLPVDRPGQDFRSVAKQIVAAESREA